MKRSRRLRVVVLALGVLVAAFLLRGPLMRASVAALIDVLSGDRIAFASLEVVASDPVGARAADPAAWLVVARGVHLENPSGPLLDADRVALAIDPHDVLPGSRHRFGLRAAEIVRPSVQIRREEDGALSLAAPGADRSGGGASDTPYAFALDVLDGRVTFDDPYRKLVGSRRFVLAGVALHGVVAPGAVTYYRLDGTLLTAGGAADPVRVTGTIDDTRGFSTQRLVARRLPVEAIANYFIDSPTAQVLAGSVRDFSLAAYALGTPGDARAYHVSGGGTLDGVALRIPGLILPATEMRGRIDLSDAGLLAPHVAARLGALPLRVAGGVIDWAAPHLRLGVAATTDFRDVRRLFAFSRRLPIAGAAALTSLVEGPVGDPLVDARVASPRTVYDGFPIDGLRGRVVYAQSVLDVLPAAGRYGAADVAVDGTIALGDRAHPRLFVDVRGPAAAVPYAAQAAPDADLHANGYLEGDGLALDAEGLLDGNGPATALGGLFRLDRYGDGAFGPLLVRRSTGATLAGTLYMNRRESESGFWIAADGYPSVLSGAKLPGLPDFGPPPFAGTLDGSVVGDGHPERFRIAGRVAGRDLAISGVRIARVRGDVTGNFTAMRLGGVHAEGTWGALDGDATFVGRDLAFQGEYRGSFERLETFTGKLGGRGPIEGPVALVLGPTRTIVQARGDRTGGATVQGVPVGAIAGTLTVRGKQVDVLAADVTLPGAALALAGSVDRRGGLGVSVAGADARALRAAGSPLDAGRVAAIGDFGAGDPGRPRFSGGVAVADGRVGGYAFAGDADVALGGGAAVLSGAAATLDGAYGRVDGTLSNLGARRATGYDLGVRVRDLALGPLARRAFPERTDVDGTVDGDVRVRGSGSVPRFDGSLAIRSGTVQGQYVPEIAGQVGYDRVAGALVDGHLLVGGTAARFSFGGAADAVHARLTAPRANLADFDDLFDQGDVLGGKGRVDLFFTRSGAAVSTAADVAIAGLRVRGFDLGDAAARWRSSGNRVEGSFNFGGASGRLGAEGTLTLATREPLDRVLQRSRFDGKADLDGLDLGTWLPVLGYAVPVTGHVDADATVHGSLLAPSAVTHATLLQGSIGKFPIDRFQISATSNLARTTIENAELDLLTLHVTGRGSFGLTPTSPVNLALHATGGDIGALSARLFGAGKFDVRGRAETDVTVSGTRARPKVIGGFDVENAAVGGVAIPQALGEVSLEGSDIVLSGAAVDFAKGNLQLAGSLPLQLQPFALGPPAASLALDVTANGIDLTDFASLLPAGSTLAGHLDGRVALGGTVEAPRLAGQVLLAGGAIESPFERERLANIAAKLTFRGSGAQLESLHAEAGGGALDATGRIRFADLGHPTTEGAYALDARAKGLRLDLPEFGRGTVDGTLSFTHEPGALPALTAAATLQDGIIPFSALLLAAGSTTGGPPDSVVVPAPAATGGPGAPAATGDMTLALALNAGRNVRVRSGNVDIGGRGALSVTGTRSAPVLTGSFDSTGGTLTYFNTLFRVQRGTVSFEPDLGVIPYLRARATSHVTDPDPNPTRNLSGFADITLDISGPVSNLAIDLQSDPPYDRQQILGLLLSAPQLGATSLFDQTTGVSPLGTLPAGQINPNAGRTVAGLEAQRQPTASGDIFATSVGEEAFGVVNAQFTRNLLAPFESAFSDAIGLSAVNINVDYTGNVGLTARKILGKSVNAIYSTTFGYPYRQSVGFEIRPSESTAAQVTVFQTIGNAILGLGIPNTVILPATNNTRIGAAQPANGSLGFSLSLQRLLK